MTDNLITVAYIGASALFILSLGGLSRQETAGQGNIFGIVGMLIAFVATAFSPAVNNYTTLIGAIVPAVIIGVILASRVAMTSMPELVAILHSFVGLAAVLVGIGNYLQPHSGVPAGEEVIHQLEIYIGVFIGAVTLTGSIVAFGKLRAIISSKPLMLPARHFLNIGLLLATVYCGFNFMSAEGTAGITPLLIMTGIACLLGIHLVAAIGVLEHGASDPEDLVVGVGGDHEDALGSVGHGAGVAFSV